MKITKAVIPVAGLGLRFLPATKAQPKEVIPIIDKPAIQYVVEEAVRAGITDILFITGRGKRAIEDYFDKSYEVEEELKKKGKHEQVELLENIVNLANFYYIRQKEVKGLGHAIYQAKSFVGSEHFAVLLGDDIMSADSPGLKELCRIQQLKKSNVVGVKKVAIEKISKYGVVAGKMATDGVLEVEDLVEKPKPEDAPSDLAIIGRYIISPGIFKILEDLPPGVNGEIQLTDALRILNKTEKIFAYEIPGKRFDIGDKVGFLQASIELALEHDEIGGEIRDYLKDLVGKI